jgi:hypothetical protein
VEVYRLADELGVSTVEIISAMEKLDIPFQLPNPSVSIDDAQKIKASFKKGSGFSFKNISFFIAAVVSLTFVLSINSDRVFADDTAPPPVATASEPTVSSLLAFKEQVVVASEAIKDSFTVMVQEKLIDLGLLSGPATGINDKVTQEAIKSFQEKAGLEKIDGMVGPETLPKLLQGEAAYTTSATSTSNENGPVWGDDQLQFMRVNGTYMDVLWGHITHDKPIDTFQLYVDGELHTTLDANGCMNSCSSTSGDMRFKINGLAVETTYEFEVVACDSDNNCSSNNPTTTQSTVDKTPVWDESLPLTVSELGTRFNLNIPVGAVTDDVDVAYYEVYVNHALSTYRTISDTRLFVLPKNDMTCGQQEVYIIAYDTIGQSSKSPTTTFTRNECGTTVAASPTTTTTTLPGTPSITITASEVSDGDTSSDSSLSLTFTTSASTTDFAAGDVSVSGGTLSNFAGSGTTYTATFTPTAQGATTIDVASSTFTNASTGVDNTAATQFNWTYSTAPTMTITAAEVNDGNSSADTSLSVTFTASQSTTNFTAGDVVVSGGTLSNFSGSGTTYTATFTPSAEGATTIDVAGGTFTNAFGTNNTAATQFNWTYVDVVTAYAFERLGIILENSNSNPAPSDTNTVDQDVITIDDISEYGVVHIGVNFNQCSTFDIGSSTTRDMLEDSASLTKIKQYIELGGVVWFNVEWWNGNPSERACSDKSNINAMMTLLGTTIRASTDQAFVGNADRSTDPAVVASNFPTTENHDASVIWTGGTPVYTIENGTKALSVYEKIGNGILFVQGDTNIFSGPLYPTTYYDALRELVLNS